VLNLNAPAVLITDVDPRDSLQSAIAIMTTAHKLVWAIAQRKIEVSCFVAARLLPQMAEELLQKTGLAKGLTCARNCARNCAA
jgi:isopropylmalate/homocitrate/citramalate synthase